MTWMFVASGFWIGIHLIVGSPVRTAIAARIGEIGFRGLFALLSAVGLAGLIFAWIAAPYVALWPPGTGLGYAPIVVMPFALLFLVYSLTQPNPTSAGPEPKAGTELPVRGMTRITRHPGLWAFALWAVAHLLANGDLASLLLFGSILLVALNGMSSIDRKLLRKLGTGYEVFRQRTSILPFAAIAAGRQTMSWRELGWWRPLLALALYVALLHVHGELFGVPAIPGMTMGG